MQDSTSNPHLRTRFVIKTGLFELPFQSGSKSSVFSTEKVA